jgi:hypothetical protein
MGVIAIKRIQFYIPSLFEFQDNHSRGNKEKIRVVGVKKNYISGYREKEMTHIDQIVAEDFTVYDLLLDCEANLLSFYLEHEEQSNQTKVLEKVFKTFIFEYNEKSFGYLTIAKGKHRPRTLVK